MTHVWVVIVEVVDAGGTVIQASASSVHTTEESAVLAMMSQHPPSIIPRTTVRLRLEVVPIYP